MIDHPEEMLFKCFLTLHLFNIFQFLCAKSFGIPSVCVCIDINSYQASRSSHSTPPHFMRGYQRDEGGTGIRPLSFSSKFTPMCTAQCVQAVHGCICVTVNCKLLVQNTVNIPKCVNCIVSFALMQEVNYSFQESLRSLISASHLDDPKSLQSFQNSGLCETHSWISKKANLTGIILEDYSEMDLEKGLQQYSTSVLHLESSGVLRGERLSSLSTSQKINRLLQFFPNVQAVNLSFNDVECLDGISSCRSLKHLILHGHRLQEIPQEMAKLKDTVMTLDLSSGPLCSLPDFICNFKNLRQLKLGFTLVSELPGQFGHLLRLRMLDLSGCPIGKLPESFRRLRVSCKL